MNGRYPNFFPKTLSLALALIAFGCADSSQNGTLSQASDMAHHAASSVNTLWVNLNASAEKLDDNSSGTDLKTGERKLSAQLKTMNDTASDKYKLLKAQLDRLDAASQLQAAKVDFYKLQTVGKDFQATTDKAKADIQEAQTRYEKAKEDVAEIRSHASKLISDSGLSPSP